MIDSFIEQTPFFAAGHRTLAASLATFIQREIEPRAIEERDGDAYVINGTKRFISNAGIADFYIVFARTSTRADGRPELSAFVVGSRVPGFSVVERTALMSPHPIGEIKFSGCRVPAEDMV